MKKITREQEQSIIRLWNEGKSIAIISEETKHGRNTIHRCLVRNKLCRNAGFENKFSLEEEKQICEQYKSGMSFAELERHWSNRATLGTYINIIDRHGIEKRGYEIRPEMHKNWKGGKCTGKNGYIFVRIESDNPYWCMAKPFNKNCNSGYIMEHRLIVAQHLGRPLDRKETIHHINGNTADNRIENLQLRTSGHGPGQCWRCADCGSKNIIADEI